MLWLLVSCLLHFSNGYKILVFSPTISRSHMISNGRIADELAKAGHDVVLFEPDFLNIWEKVPAATVARRWPVKGFNDDLYTVLSSFSMDIFQDMSLFDMIQGELAYQGAYDSMCKQIIENDSLIVQLRSENFDAYFGEQINLCGHGLAHALDIKIYFWISSCPIFESMSLNTGLPTPFSYVPAGGMSFYTEPGYFLRAKNLLYGLYSYGMSSYVHWRTTNIFREKFGNYFPSVAEIAGNSDIIFISSDEFVEISRPENPNMIHIGGLGLNEEKKIELNEAFEREMSSGRNGVIFFSLGTIVNTTLLPPIVMHNMGTVAKAFPDYHFILRVDSYDTQAKKIAEGVPNLSVHDWVPQVALLNHPKMRLFITHSGYNGIMEAARAGLPLLTVPFMFDQAKNSQAVTQHGWGLSIHRRTLRDEPEKMIDAVKKLLEEEKYKTSALRIQRLIKEKPFNASEKLVKTTEFVISNGGAKELLTVGRQHSFVTYYNLDIILPFFILVYLILSTFIQLVTRFLRSTENPRVKVKTS